MDQTLISKEKQRDDVWDTTGSSADHRHLANSAATLPSCCVGALERGEALRLPKCFKIPLSHFGVCTKVCASMMLEPKNKPSPMILSFDSIWDLRSHGWLMVNGMNWYGLWHWVNPTLQASQVRISVPKLDHGTQKELDMLGDLEIWIKRGFPRIVWMSLSANSPKFHAQLSFVL